MMRMTNNNWLVAIDEANKELYDRYSQVLHINSDLDRKLVSFQANKNKKEHRWCKYKEAFSASLIRYVFERTGIKTGRIIDPFAGSGTAIFAASDLGIDSLGIELLPSSAEIIKVRQLLRSPDKQNLADGLREFKNARSWLSKGQRKKIDYLRITQGAFPKETENALERYLYETSRCTDPKLQQVLRFVALCVLESISYTRKDGQYLRWDWRSGRNPGKCKFDKGKILTFNEAIENKIEEICSDLIEENSLFSSLFLSEIRAGKIDLMVGSCLELLPTLESNSFDGLITSPPYCNRYDYTRTYALELNLLGIGEQEIKNLRQTMLSCTVENKDKDYLETVTDSNNYQKAIKSWSSQKVLNLILDYLDDCRKQKTINNNGIPRMVRNYFKEMAVVIFEAARILKPNAPFIMVNDNVRYQGANVPVDLILSDFARDAGFDIEKIWILPRGKGNSSQQMGLHGREELRKCVYVWRKADLKARSTKNLIQPLARSL